MIFGARYILFCHGNAHNRDSSLFFFNVGGILDKQFYALCKYESKVPSFREVYGSVPFMIYKKQVRGIIRTTYGDITFVSACMCVCYEWIFLDTNALKKASSLENSNWTNSSSYLVLLPKFCHLRCFIINSMTIYWLWSTDCTTFSLEQRWNITKIWLNKNWLKNINRVFIWQERVKNSYPLF